MIRSRQESIRELFDHSVDLPPSERHAFLAERCSQDPLLRTAVESLLAAHDRAGQFLSDPLIPRERLFPPDLLTPGAEVGPYKLVRVLGEGGYGTVYEAEQRRPLHRRVALKLIKAGMDTRQVIARFELERQALARMDHPNIAKVLDAGITDGGRPYFVMELVDGVPINEYCRTHKLELPQRLELFTAVCRAIQHAHQKGIIHRDLKPGNVLVCNRDGAAVPRVIDFGIAKAIESPGEEGQLTEVQQLLGTPQYMSPEQLQSGGREVDTRTDIYSLGTLLYELLAEVPPFEPADLRKSGYARMRQIICEVDPPTPSSRLTMRLCTLPADSPAITIEAQHRAKAVRGDLDWIVVKAMDKDPSRRYGTAEAMALDVVRFLSDEPVVAAPPGSLYRLGKFARRHRYLVGSVCGIAAALVLGIAVALWGLARARSSAAAESTARRMAEQQRLAAEAGAREARDQAQKLLGAQKAFYRLFSGDDQPVPRQVLDFVCARADQSLTGQHPDSDVALRVGLGTGYMQQNLWAQAEQQFRKAIVLQHKLSAPEKPDLAAMLNSLGICLTYQLKSDEAESVLRQSLAMYHRLGFHVVAPTSVRLNLSAALCAKGDVAGAEAVLREALAIVRGTPLERTFDPLSEIRSLTDALQKQGDTARAEALRSSADVIREHLSRSAPSHNLQCRPGSTGASPSQRCASL